MRGSGCSCVGRKGFELGGIYLVFLISEPEIRARIGTVQFRVPALLGKRVPDISLY